MIRAEVSCRLLECVAPWSRILKSDLTWAAAKAITVGDELIAFDEQINGISGGRGKGRGHAHKFRAAVVTNVHRLHDRPRVRVVTTHGETIVAANHPFVARNDKQERRWVAASDLVPGARMAFLAEPWEVDESHAAGYLAGFFDGEGWIGRVNVGFGQNNGPTLDRVLYLLSAFGFEFHHSSGKRNCHCEITNGIRPTLRFLGMIRPPRLVPKARQIWEGRRTWGKQSPVCRVLRVEPVEDGDVIAIETTTHTYISDGFFSHNCDFSGIEAVLTGYAQRHIDPTQAFDYIRLARLGIHAAVTARAVGKPADLTWPDAKLKAYLQEIKSAYPWEYDCSKRVVHGSNYGLTIHGMVEKFPEIYKTLADAQRFQNFYYEIAPALAPQMKALRHRAREKGYLGGPTLPGAAPSQWDHAYGYRHWFWDVLSYQPTDEFTAHKWAMAAATRDRIVYLHGRPFKVIPGNDWNRVIAFGPQSTAAGRLKEVQRALFLPWSPDYIGDCYFGRTPLLGPIHDSLLLHIPNRCWDRVVEIVCRVMQEPSSYLPVPAEWGFGPYLPIGISAKTGKNWAPGLSEEQIAKIQAKAAASGKPVPTLRPNLTGMEEISFPTWQWVEHAGADLPVLPREDEGSLEDWNALQRVVA